MQDRRALDRTCENQSTPLQSRPDGARHVSVQIAAKTAKIHHIRLREIAPVSSTPMLPLCTCPKDCRYLATRFLTRNGRSFTKIRQGWQFGQALAAFGAGEILQSGECRRRDRRALPGVPGTQPGSVWCATPSGKQTSTKRRDVQFSPTCQSGRSVCCRLTQREDSC
jgi:hypothetical protein